MSKKHSVGIIILNWNSFEITAQCLNSFEELQMNYTLLVVDNGSKDDSVKLLEVNYPNVVLIESEMNLGFAAGNNLGIKYFLKRNFDYILLLNNDTLFNEDFVDPLVNYMNQNPTAGAIQPKIYFNHDRSLIWNAGTKYYHFLGQTVTTGEGKKDQEAYNVGRETPWITGCCFMVRKKVLEEVGLLDDRFFAYFEDVDFSFRIRSRGYKLVYHPSSSIYHIAGVSLKMKKKGKEGFLFPLFHYLNIRNQLYLIRKHSKWYHWPTISIFLLFKTCLYLSYFLLRGRTQKAKMFILGVMDGMMKNISMDRS